MIENKQKVLNLLGLAQRAGKVISGNDLVLTNIKHQKAKVVFLAEEAGFHTVKEFNFMSKKFNIPLIQIFNGDELSDAIGKPRKIIAVVDQGFAEAMLNLINQGV